MWLFGRKTQPSPKTSQPVQISIRTRDEQSDNDNRYDSFSYQQNNTSGLDSSIINQPEEDDDTIEQDDDKSESTSSLSGSRFGNHLYVSNSSYNRSFTREPLDPRIWSSVTSPGFTSRVIQQANGTSRFSPLKELRGNKSPFSRSPNGSLKLGELPVAVPRRATSSLINFPSPRGSGLLTYGRYSRVNKRDTRNGNGTVFVKIAPVDLKGSSPSVTPMSPSSNGSVSPSGITFTSFNEPSSQGLGGIPQTGLTQRFSRLWQNKPPTKQGQIPPGLGYQHQSPSSPGPSNIIEALSNRKRARELDLSVDANKIIRPISSSTPIVNTDDMNKHSKRVKFVSEQDIRLHRPLTFDPYQDLNSSGNEQLTSKSILEQMNQTEKRFFSDTSPVTSAAKKSKLMSTPRGSSTPIVRKRRVENGIGFVDYDDDETFGDPKIKTGKFCHCNECYAEAAGLTSPVRSNQLSPNSKPNNNSTKKTVTFDEASLQRQRDLESAVLDKGTETLAQLNKPEVVIRKASHSSGYITKEKYDHDRVKRLERFRRILGLQTEDTIDSVEGSNSLIQPISIVSQPSQMLETVPSAAPAAIPSVVSSAVPSSVSTVSNGICNNTSFVTTTGSLNGVSCAPITSQNQQQSQQEISTFGNTGSSSSTDPANASESSAVISSSTTTPSTSLSFPSSQLTTTAGFPFGQQKSQPEISNLNQQQPQQEMSNFGNAESLSSTSLANAGESTTVNSSSTTPSTSFSFPSSQLTTTTAGFSFGQQKPQPAISNLNQQQSQQQTNIFGNTGSLSSTAPVFGSSNAIESTTVNSSSTTTPSTSFSFPSSQPTTTTAGFSFGQQQSQPVTTNLNQQQSQQQTNIFGNGGSSSSTVPVFGSANAIVSSTVNSSSTTPSSTFSFPSSQPTTTTGGFSFGQQQSQPAISNLNQQQPQQQMSIFGNTGSLSSIAPAFGSPNTGESSAVNPSSTTPSTSFSFPSSQLTTTAGFSFGQQNSQPAISNLNQQQPQQQMNIFGNTGSSSLTAPAFGSANAIESTTVNSSSTTTPSTSFSFPSSQPTTTTAGFSFGQQQSQPVTTNLNQQQPQQQMNIFGNTGGSSSTAPVFGSANAIVSSTVNSSSTTPSTTFSFPSSQPTTTTGGFSFGQQQSQPAISNLNQQQPQQPVFQFGNPMQPQSAQGGFQQPMNIFGNSGSSSSTAPAFGSANAIVSTAVNSSSTTPSTSFSFPSSQPTTAGGFSFGQQQSQLAISNLNQQQPQQPVFQFGNPMQPQSAQGGFNFGAQAVPNQFGGAVQPAPNQLNQFGGANPNPGMFSVGQPTAAPRRRGPRRYR